MWNSRSIALNKVFKYLFSHKNPLTREEEKKTLSKTPPPHIKRNVHLMSMRETDLIFISQSGVVWQ